MPPEPKRRPRKRYPKYVNRSVTRHGKVVFYFRKDRGEHIRLPDDPDSDEFKSAYAAALGGAPIPVRRSAGRNRAAENKQRVEQSLKICLKSARQRAAKRGMEFSITLDMLLDRAEETGCCCELTGIQFFTELWR